MEECRMRIAIFGLGYVGVVTAACLAHEGHVVIGVDIDPDKVDLVNRGRSPIVEDGVGDFLSEAVAAERLSATSDPMAAMAGIDICLVCVGTPSRKDGSLDLTYAQRACRQIGRALRRLGTSPTIVVRSTVLPGTSRDVLLPLFEDASGKQVGVGFGYCYNPEFLREGTAVEDFFHPPKTVIGGGDEASRKRLRSLYADLPAPIVETDITTAEFVKYTDNVWHALKVGFANEIGTLCKALRVDSHEVMGIFRRDTKLNLSPAYLKPGFAFGGSCLPKDLRAIVHRSRELALDLPILSSVLPSNELQIGRAYGLIETQGRRRIGIFGLSFKAGTDDLRESPMVHIVRRLISDGCDLRIYDRNINLAMLRGANLAYLNDRIPSVSTMLCGTPSEVADFADVLVIGNDEREHRESLTELPAGKVVIDFARVVEPQHLKGDYHGLCW
jgi:GDP-mannose 6-dehydrogenase